MNPPPAGDECMFASGLWDGDALPAADLGGGMIAAGVRLSLQPMQLGGEEMSWTANVLETAGPSFGPFRLAYISRHFLQRPPTVERAARRIPMSDRLPLLGCTPEPLMNYLKALGVFRLVAEKPDPDAKLSWHSGVACLHSTLTRNDLAKVLSPAIPTDTHSRPVEWWQRVYAIWQRAPWTRL